LTAFGVNLPLDDSVPILVVQVGGSVFGHGPLAIARTGGRMGIPVYGVPVETRVPGARSRYWTGLFSPPEENGSPDAWVDLLSDIGRRLGRAVLIPIDDAATVLVADNAETLREHFYFPDQPAELMRTLSDKGEMFRLCRQLDIPVPETEFPESTREVERFAEGAQFPVVAKRIAAWLPARAPSPPSVVIARTQEELLAAHDRMECPDGPNVLLQEYIPGASDSIWMFNGYFDQHSECLVGFTGRKLRQRGPRTGVTTLGLCTSNPTVDGDTRRLMKAVGYRGILDIGYRYDHRDARYKLLDVNPRIGQSFRLFVGTNGLDVLSALYRDLTGQPVPEATGPDHRKWIVEPFDLVSAMQLWREGELGPRDWLRSLRGIDETAWFAKDDPRPFGAMLARSVLELVRRHG
jgi:D-aspartate ligase